MLFRTSCSGNPLGEGDCVWLGVPELVPVSEGVTLGVPLSVGVELGVTAAEDDPVADIVWLGVWLPLRVRLADDVPLADGVGLPLRVPEAEGVGEPVRVPLPEGVRAAEALCVLVVVIDGVCEDVAVPLHVSDGVPDTLAVPELLRVPLIDGLGVGLRELVVVGVPDTLRVTDVLGVPDELGVGLDVWDREGAHVCWIDERLSAR